MSASHLGGHFGRTDLNLPWERTDRADPLKPQPEPDRGKAFYASRVGWFSVTEVITGPLML